MLLHNEALTKAMRRPSLDDRLVVMPLLEDKQVTEASVDLRLGPEFILLRRTDESGLDAADQPQAVAERMHARVNVEIGQALWLHPGQFVLGATLEFLRIPADLAAYVLGRSSWGRVGLIPATAIFVQPGFAGCLTLELVNHGESPIALYPGLRIAQLVVHALPSATEHAYGADDDHKYVGPTGPQISHLAKEAHEIAHLHELRGRLSGAADGPGLGTDRLAPART
jgi:dCTP deaminase